MSFILNVLCYTSGSSLNWIFSLFSGISWTLGGLKSPFLLCFVEGGRVYSSGSEGCSTLKILSCFCLFKMDFLFKLKEKFLFWIEKGLVSLEEISPAGVIGGSPQLFYLIKLPVLGSLYSLNWFFLFVFTGEYSSWRDFFIFSGLRLLLLFFYLAPS